MFKEWLDQVVEVQLRNPRDGKSYFYHGLLTAFTSTHTKIDDMKEGEMSFRNVDIVNMRKLSSFKINILLSKLNLSNFESNILTERRKFSDKFGSNEKMIEEYKKKVELYRNGRTSNTKGV